MYNLTWNPLVNDQSGQILADGQNRASATKLDSMKLLASSIAEAGKNVGAGISAGVQKYQTNKMTRERNQGAIDLGVQKGMLDPELGQKLSDMPTAKQSAYIADLQSQNELANWITKEHARESMSRWTPSAQDQMNARNAGGELLQTSKGGAQYIPDPRQPTPHYQPVATDQGMIAFDPQNPSNSVPMTDQNGNPLTKTKPANPLDALTANILGTQPNLTSPQGAQPPKGVQPNPAPPTITSQAEYDALPSGAPFLYNGTQGIKP